ncbi:hypothetical protein EJP82_27710 [Paenibacillus anaericanus]|uniref:Uncharacterized protein n=1 Tax=Paenibacillus anaericanus TaxID=170367 RepID=A0A3S1BD19_9BACL|nr:hypothetical protein [Paenibacillus anaericanus]RUT37800.1 hypothetical protein EJP82_27710 [Paenibacillus anaericanus]
MRKIMTNIIIIFLCFIIQLPIFNNFVFADNSGSSNILQEQRSTSTMSSTSNGIGTRSTDVWVDDYFSEYGNAIDIHYSFLETHPVQITVTREDGWEQTYSQYTGNAYHNIFEFNPPDDGRYTFRVQPIDESSEFGGQVSVTVYKNIVIVVPGIMVSELFVGNNQVWKPKQYVWGG